MTDTLTFTLHLLREGKIIKFQTWQKPNHILYRTVIDSTIYGMKISNLISCLGEILNVKP